MKRKLLGTFIGIILTFVFLEVSIRISSSLFSYYQDKKNERPLDHQIEQGKKISIVVIGESTTAVAANEINTLLVQETAYPFYLEQKLNEKQNKYHFEVANKGIMAGNTTKVASELRKYLADHNPDIIIAMMGMKDTQDPTMIKAIVKKTDRFLQHSTVYNLICLFYNQYMVRTRNIDDSAPVNKFEDLSTEFLRTNHRFAFDSIYKQMETNPTSESEITRLTKEFFLVNYYMSTGQLKKCEALLKKTIAETGYGHFLLVTLFIRDNNFKAAEDVLSGVIKRFPNSPYAYKDLAILFLNDKNIKAAEKTLALASNKGFSTLPPILIARSQLEKEKGNYSAGINLLKNQCNFDNPDLLVMDEINKELIKTKTDVKLIMKKENVLRFMKKDSYLECIYFLSELLYLNKNFDLAEKNLQNYNVYNGRANTATDLLRKVYEAQGDTEKALALLKGASQNNNRLGEYFALVNLYKQSNQLSEINGVYEAAKKDFPETAQSFRDVYAMAKKKGAKLIFMQYPTFSVEFLKSFTSNLPGVYYVSNETIFNDAPKTTYFFEPRFPYNFNHYTNRGSQVLASHLADEILKGMEKGKL